MPRRPSVLFCIDQLPANGGTEKQLIGLIERLDRRRCEVQLCTLHHFPDQPELPECPHVSLDVISLGRPAAWRGAARLARRLRAGRVDVVHAFFQDAAVVAAVAARAAGVPVRLRALRDLGFWRRGANQLPLRLVQPLFTGYVANSQAVADHFRAADRLPAARIAVIPNGISPAEFEFVDHDEAAPAVGIVSNLDRPVKRLDLFLRAAALLARERPELTWHVVGTGVRLPDLQALARDLGLAGRMVFAGAVRDVNAYLGRLGIGVICSDSEGFSNALLEYMLRGCAAVATAVGGNREAIRHGETGLLVPPGDAAALARAIGRLVADPVERRRLARRAREEAASRYDWSRCVEAHHELYARAVAEEAGRRGRDGHVR